MGMFDYIRHEGKVYQTKDTPDQYMHEYRIVNGRLLGDKWHCETIPKAERPYPNAPDDSFDSLIGSVRTVIDEADVDQNWHGYIYMIEDGAGASFQEYRAKFTDGTLVEFVPVGSPDLGDEK